VRRTFERGIEHALRALAVDPAREEVHRHIMRLHALAGHRTQAMRQYQSCERILMQELGVKPSASTRGLYEAIREDRFDAAAPAADALPASLLGLAHSDLPALLHTLQSVQAAFVSIESRLRHLIGDVGMGDSKPS
jgi:DNA-binding SARP family transcriptional activator